MFGVDILDLDLGSKLILSKNLSRASLWVRETCLTARRRLLTSFVILGLGFGFGPRTSFLDAIVVGSDSIVG